MEDGIVFHSWIYHTSTLKFWEENLSIDSKFSIRGSHVKRHEITYRWVLIAMSSHYWYLPLREKCLCSEFFWSVFSRIRTNPNKIRNRKTLNADNSKAVYIVTFTKIQYFFSYYAARNKNHLTLDGFVWENKFASRGNIFSH